MGPFRTNPMGKDCYLMNGSNNLPVEGLIFHLPDAPPGLHARAGCPYLPIPMYRLLFSIACAAAVAGNAAAQTEAVTQPAAVPQAPADSEPLPISEQITPFSVWLDFNVLARPNSPKPALPIWFESFHSDTAKAQGAIPPKTTFRLRLRKMPDLHRELLLRVYFNDLPDMLPEVSAWSEAGRQRFRSTPLGTGVGLPTQESVVVPLDGADYLDIEVPGDGSSIRGAFVSSLKEALTRQANDFHAPAGLVDPFGAAGPVVREEEDKKLFGRVKALVDPGIVRLSQQDGTSADWTFDLAQQPLVTLVTFEVLNPDMTAPPVVVANEGDPAFASVQWPDLADPGFRGESRSLEPSMRFQYTGWLRAQAVIPGHVLRSGLNKITIGLSEDSGPVAVRNVELQLKQNWKHFDYILSPVNP